MQLLKYEKSSDNNVHNSLDFFGYIGNESNNL